MGFFSDLREDLSQAVNELNEQINVNEKGATEKQADILMQPTAEEQPRAVEQPTEPEPMLSLDEMLENIDSSGFPEEFLQESETILPAAAEEQNSSLRGSGSAEESMKRILEELPSVEEISEEPKQPDLAEEIPEEPKQPGLTEEIPGEPEKSDVLEEGALKEQEEKTTEYENENSKGAEREMETNIERVAVDETSVITEGMVITGDIITEGSIDLIGTVNGNIDAFGKLNITGHINGNSKAAEIYAEGAKINGEIVSEGAVKIGASSVVIGNITAVSAAIAGAVKGDIDVRGPVILDSSAIVMGNIKSKSVQINNGAVIEGMCSQCYADVNPISFFDDYKPEVRKSKSK